MFTARAIMEHKGSVGIGATLSLIPLLPLVPVSSEKNKTKRLYLLVGALLVSCALAIITYLCHRLLSHTGTYIDCNWGTDGAVRRVSDDDYEFFRWDEGCLGLNVLFFLGLGYAFFAVVYLGVLVVISQRD